jgi:DNA-binding XRE family transcriptional regulator
MDKKKRERLEAAGFRVGNAEDFLGLTEEERRLVDLRVSVSRAIRQRREDRDLTQKQLAQRLGSSQSRVAKMEACAPDVSLDLCFRALFALGGTLDELIVVTGQRARPARKAAPRQQVPRARTAKGPSAKHIGHV